MAPPSGKGKTRMEEEEDGRVMETVAAAGAAVGVAAALWGLSKLFGGAGEKEKEKEQVKEKMMKAPGKDFFIPRKDFDRAPAEWFRNNRS